MYFGFVKVIAKFLPYDCSMYGKREGISAEVEWALLSEVRNTSWANLENYVIYRHDRFDLVREEKLRNDVSRSRPCH
jgi:hypothetical protein